MDKNLIMFIGLPVAGIVLGWIIRWCYARFQLSASEQKAERLRQDAIKEAEAQKKEILLNAKDELIRERNQQERENRGRRAEDAGVLEWYALLCARSRSGARRADAASAAEEVHPPGLCSHIREQHDAEHRRFCE